MSRHGFTLVEVLIVIAIMSILLSITSMQFTDYLRRGAIERQTKELYSDLMATRTAAVTQHSPRRVIVTPTVFTFISSAMGNNSGRTTRTLARTITWSGRGTATQTEIIFDERGTFNIDVSAGNTTICVDPSLESVLYDRIVVFSTRIHLGKATVFEGACDSDHVNVQ